jgi:hypothetical protein
MHQSVHALNLLIQSSLAQLDNCLSNFAVNFHSSEVDCDPENAAHPADRMQWKLVSNYYGVRVRLCAVCV